MEAGLPQQAIETELRKLPPETPAIELDEADEGLAAALFLGLSTQWRSAGLSAALTGLDYAAIEPAARMLDIDLTPRLFLDLRLMEGEALAAMNERISP